LVRGGRGYAVSRDHKPEDASEEKRIKKAGGFVTENRRVGGVLALSRALGDVDLQPWVTWRPEVMGARLGKEDQMLIIGCDGLWDVLTNQQAAEVALRHLDDPVSAAIRLRDTAYLLGSTDNISVIVVLLPSAVAAVVQGGSTPTTPTTPPTPTAPSSVTSVAYAGDLIVGDTNNKEAL